MVGSLSRLFYQNIDRIFVNGTEFSLKSTSMSINTIEWVFSLVWVDLSSNLQCGLLCYAGLVD